jgi:ATP phosphoribosyltransferase
VSGSVEAACGLGLADGIVDLVETGTTMRVGGCVETVCVVSIDVDDYC